MSPINKLPKIIFIIGVDGAGKTLYTNMLLEKLRKDGIDAVHVWSRYNNFISKPLLGLTRLTGHNYKEYHDGVEFGYHDFGRSKLLSYLFISLQIIDLNLATFFKIKRRVKNNRVLVCDRGPYDTMVDVMLDTGNTYLSKKIIKLFLITLPEKHVTLLINRPVEKIFQDRKEMKHDRTLPRKDLLYTKCCNYFNWKVIENNKTPDHVLNHKWPSVGEDRRSDSTANKLPTEVQHGIHREGYGICPRLSSGLPARTQRAQRLLSIGT